MQKNLALIAERRMAPHAIEPSLVRMWKTPQEAMRMCCERAVVKRPKRMIAELLRPVMGDKFNEGSLNTILNCDAPRAERNRWPNPLMLMELELINENTAITQWLQMYKTRQLDCQQSIETKKAALREEYERKLKQLEG